MRTVGHKVGHKRVETWCGFGRLLIFDGVKRPSVCSVDPTAKSVEGEGDIRKSIIINQESSTIQYLNNTVYDC